MLLKINQEVEEVMEHLGEEELEGKEGDYGEGPEGKEEV
jgi:hypothetical protein